jgi:hypothetical protein
MNFQFGSARQLYTRRVHPRVWLGPKDLPRLRALVRRGLHRKLMAALRAKTAPLVERILSADDVPAMIAKWNTHWNQPGTAVVWELHDIALVGVLDDNAAALDATRRVLAALPRADELVGRTGKTVGYGMEPHTLVAYDLLHDRLNEAERQAFCAWVVDFWVRFPLHHLSGHYFRGAGANIPMGELLTGLMGLLVVEGDAGVPDLSAERKQMLLMLEASLHCSLGPKGYPAEDIGYGTAMGAWLAFVVEAVRRAGWYDAYEQCPRYAKFGRAILHFVQPWGGGLSNTGDHGDDFRSRGFVLSRLATETRDPTLLWLMRAIHYPPTAPPKFPDEVPVGKAQHLPADGAALLTLDARARPVHPSKAKLPTQFMDPARGIVSFRSGWDSDATFVVFDGSQRPTAAQGHAHDSCGHFSLSALGEYFAIDTGRYNIEQNCHNVVLVDGKSGRSTDGEWRMSYYHGNLIEYRPGVLCDVAAVDSSHQHNCYWARRHLGLVKGPGAPSYVWMVEDINKANDWAEFWWQLHSSPENEITLHEQSATIRGWRHGNLLDVHFALPALDAYPKAHTLTLAQDLATPSSYKYVKNLEQDAKSFARPSDMVHHRVLMRPRLLGKVAGYNGRFLSVLIPRRKGEPPARVERLPSLDNSLAVRITFGNVEDTFIWAYEHNLLEAGGVSARGQWIIERRARRDGRLVTREVAGATGLGLRG